MTASAPFTPFVPPRLGEAPVDLRAETERARTRGYAEGFAAGRAAAAEEADRRRIADEEAARVRAEEQRRTAEAAIAALHTARAALDARVAALAEQSASQIEELALSLAAVILGTETSSPARSAAHALRRALNAQPVRSWVRVLLSAQDAAVLATDPTTAALWGDVEVVSSTEVDPGGAIIELEDGAVDARIGAALQRAADAHRGGAAEPAEVRG